MNTSNRWIALVVAFAAVAGATKARSADYTWTGGSGAAWNTTSTNWSGGGSDYWTSATGTANRAFFNTAGASATVSGTVFANGLSLLNTATISSGTISLGGPTPTIDILNSASGSLLSTPLAGSGGVRFTNSSPSPNTTLVLGAVASPITGGVTIDNGVTLRAGVANQFGNLANAITVNGGLNLNSFDLRFTRFSGSGTISGPGTVRINSGTSAFSGVMSGAANVAWEAGGATLNFTGDNQTSGQWVFRNGGTLILGSTNALKTTSSMKIETAITTNLVLAAGDLRANTTNMFLNNGSVLSVRFAAAGADRNLIWTGASTGTAAPAATLTWGSFGSGQAVGSGMGFGGPLATHTLNWVSGINLNGTAGAVRQFDAINGAATVAGDIQGSISDSGTAMAVFQKTGAGTLALSGSNSFGGHVQVSDGVLRLANANALAGGGAITFAGGTLQYTASNTVDYSARITSSTARAVAVDTGGQSVTWATGLAVSNTAGLAKSGNGALILTASNSYLGPTTVSSGTLQIGNGGTVGSIDPSSAVSIGSGGALVFNRSDNYGGSFANVLSGTGRLVLTSGSLVLVGANTFSGTTQIAGGTLSIGSGTNTGSLAGTIENNGSLLFNRSGNLAFGGVISGSGGLAKAGAGTLTLSATSTYSGKTTVQGGAININSLGNVNGGASALGNPDSVFNGTIDLAGTLEYAGGTTASDRRINIGVGTGGGAITVNSASRLTLNGDIAVNATGAWSLNPAGAGSEILINGLVSGNGGNGLFVNGATGTVTLANANNSFAGPITVYQGTVSIPAIAASGSNSALGAGSSLSFGNGSFNMTGRLLFTGSAGGASNRTMAVAGANGFTNGAILENSVAGQMLALSGNVTASGSTPSLQLTGAGDGTLSGNISDGVGDLSITKSGAGAWTLSGSNSYSGATAVSQGTLLFGSVNALNSTSGVSVAAGALLAYSGASSGTFTRSISGSGGFTKSGAGTLAFSGSNGFTGATALNAGTLALASVGALSSTGTISFGGGTLQYSAANQADFSAIIRSSTGAIAIDTNGETVVFASTLDASNTGGLRKAGAGTLQLSATSTYSGATQVAAGALIVNGQLVNTSGVTVDAGATLGGSGVIAALATVNGTLSPGNSPGEITLASLALGSTATTLIEIAGTARGSQYDGITITQAGGLTYGGALSFDFASLVGDNTTFDIFNFTGTPTGSFTSVVSTGSYAGSWTNNNDGTHSLQQGSQTLTFSQLSGDVIIVPEPGVLALAGAGLAVGVLRAWSRRRSRG